MSIIGDTATSYKGVPIIWSDQIRQIRKDARDKAIMKVKAMVEEETFEGNLFGVVCCDADSLQTRLDAMLEKE